MDPVLVTGVGAVTCHGTGTRALLDAMTGARARRPDRVPDPWARMDLPLMYLAPAALPAGDGDEDGDGETGAGGAPGRAAVLALTAAREALAGAGLDRRALAAARTAVVLGTCMGSLGDRERERDRHRAGHPAAGPWRPAFDVATALAGALGLRGPAGSTSNACAAGGFALATAADMIRCGEADLVVTGGADAYSRIALAGFNRMGAVDARGCRPFTTDRAGTVFGEGAGILVLESAAHARARGARPLAGVGESGWTCDAGHPTAPEESGEQITRAMREALRRSALPPDAIGCVVPHGTGTRLNDRIESAALTRVFPRRQPPAYSLKALLGHTGGAAAALAAVAAVLILGRAAVPPNIPAGPADPDCPLPLPTAETPLAAPAVLVNAYAFGGNNISLVLQESPAC
ncbi:beta-ketoacyl synthase N-terminal-like domain-containing protein [Kitasatospora sp. NPDC056327]|uniref:beta-ketoacyl synthase N-terminal-like domain-containing protein n=1 Tax=Kitasatospora sp. NPDC056327 TaxID=3345785 RepID=UPI0035E2484F